MARQTEKVTAELDAQIRTEVGELAKRYSSRADLTREVATLLFIKHGIYPSAGAVHSYTRFGSITDISSDLKQFWASLKSRVSTEIPGTQLPASLLDKTGQVLNELWSMALAQADSSMDALREEAAASVAEHRRAKEDAAADAERVALNSAQLVAEANRLRSLAEEKSASALTQLAVEREAKESAQKMIIRAESIAQQERATRELSEQRFTSQLDSLRSEMQRHTDQLNGDLNFAKKQIEEAREISRNLKQQNDALVTELDIKEKHNRAKLSELQDLVAQQRLTLTEKSTQVSILEPQIHRFIHQLQEANQRADASSLMHQEALKSLNSAYEIIKNLSINKPESIAVAEDENDLGSEAIQDALRQQLITHVCSFEIADMYSASLEFGEKGGGSGETVLFLAISVADEQIPITPAFISLAELEAFCVRNLTQYEVLDGKMPLTGQWFWEVL